MGEDRGVTSMIARRQAAINAYWSAKSRKEQALAYFEMLYYGVVDGYGRGGWRSRLAALLRRVALHIDS